MILVVFWRVKVAQAKHLSMYLIRNKRTMENECIILTHNQIQVKDSHKHSKHTWSPNYLDTPLWIGENVC